MGNTNTSSQLSNDIKKRRTHKSSSESSKKNRKRKQIKEESPDPPLNDFEFDDESQDDEQSNSSMSDSDSFSSYIFAKSAGDSPPSSSFSSSHNQYSSTPSPTVIHWKKGGLIGHGSFGKVYLGLNTHSGELLAIKQINLDESDNVGVSREVEAIEREIAILRNLRHANIVRYYGTSCGNQKLNIFLEYVPGGSIYSLLQKFGRFSEEVTSVYTRQILTGLEHLHSNQIMHRDVKGGNVLVDHSGTVKLADFGASRKLEGIISGNGVEKSLKGTVYWMAPEVIKQQDYGYEADIWSVGCTVIEMLTGRPPWADQYPDQVSALYLIASSNQIPPFPPVVSPYAKRFLSRCLTRDMKKRPSASDLLKDTEFVMAPIAPSIRLTEQKDFQGSKSFQLPAALPNTTRKKIVSEPGPSRDRQKTSADTSSSQKSEKDKNPFLYLRTQYCKETNRDEIV
eukprot:TRINITY_DN7637_c0_g1_i1.p1 TRINITY_DN7637_c0_g1~~TRINITY_DN7637_c0_g1_i1.p1  ORF type:complete len:453 (-),score=97.92 TRINITY_DN7637_c0_g1_i1:9-1367(-)